MLIPPLRQREYPLSSSQLQLWFIENLNGGGNLYHVPMLFRLGDEVCLAAYERSLQAVVARHQVLHSLIVQMPSQSAVSRACELTLSLERVTLEAAHWPDRLRQGYRPAVRAGGGIADQGGRLPGGAAGWWVGELQPDSGASPGV